MCLLLIATYPNSGKQSAINWETRLTNLLKLVKWKEERSSKQGSEPNQILEGSAQPSFPKYISFHRRKKKLKPREVKPLTSSRMRFEQRWHDSQGRAPSNVSSLSRHLLGEGRPSWEKWMSSGVQTVWLWESGSSASFLPDSLLCST